MSKRSAVFALLAFLFLAGCKPKVAVTTPEGTVVLLSPKKAEKAMAEKQSPPIWTKIMASVEVNQNGDVQRATADIRMRKDSILWVELMDNIIGLKAARAFAMADTVAFYNRIERNYFAGSYDYVEKKLGTSLPFSYIFQVFQGQLFMPNSKAEIVNNQYIFSGMDDDGNRFLAEVEPFHLDCVRQELTTDTDVIKIKYSQFKVVDGYRFPQHIFVEVLGRKLLTATFQVKSIETKGPYPFPFNISSKYERIE